VRAGPALGVAVLPVLLAGCITPAWNAGAYQDDALKAVQSALSQARTGELAVRALQSRSASTAYADTVVSGAEDAVGPIQASFGAVQPPSRAQDPLRERVGALLTDTGDALASARIAVRRGDRAAMLAARRQLDEVAARLQREQARLQ
jgi:hypothetical protein